MSNSRDPLLNDAVMYVQEVKDAYCDNAVVYGRFLRLLNDFRAERIDLEAIKEEVAVLFSDHRELISRFNSFLPPTGRAIPAPADDGQVGDDESESKDD